MWSDLIKLCVLTDNDNVTETLEKMKVEVALNRRCLHQRALSGSSPLHFAVLSGQIDIVYFLIRCGIKANIRNFSGESPLHYAAQLGNIPVARILLRSGAKINCRDMNQKSPLHWAIEADQNNMVEYLQSKSAAIEKSITHLKQQIKTIVSPVSN